MYNPLSGADGEYIKLENIGEETIPLGNLRFVEGINYEFPESTLDPSQSVYVVKNIEVYGEMHRYIPLIAKWAGFQNITEKVVKHQARKFGKTKFGLERFIFGFLDLFSITFIGKFGKRPMHLFGTLGIIVFIIGFSFLIYIGIDKIFLDKGAKLIANRTEFYIAITSIIIGVQFFLAGFLGEMLSRNSPNRNQYQIREKLNVND